MTDVAVIGAGISGLTTAYHLGARGHRVVVLERQKHLGGNAVSERIGEFLMEHGPTSVSAQVEAIATLSSELGLDSKRVSLGQDVRYRYLTKDGVAVGIPAHPFGFFTSSYLSPAARLRLLAEVLVPSKSGDGEESVADFCRRRLGGEFAERIIEPLVGGLFAANASDLSMALAFPALADMERRFGSIIVGALMRHIQGAKMPARRLFSWRAGIASLPKTLGDRMGAVVRTGVAVRSIVAKPGGFGIDMGAAGTLDARAVVVATQPHVAATFLETSDPAGAEALFGILAPPISVVFLGYKRSQVAHPLDGIGYLTPIAEKRNVSGVLFPSTMFPARAPDDHIALAAYVGGSRAPEHSKLPADDLIALVREEFADLLGARGEPVVARVRQWPRGLPQLCLGHSRRLEIIDETQKKAPGLFLTGNYFSGPGITACVAQAIAASGRAHSYLAGSANRSASTYVRRQANL